MKRIIVIGTVFLLVFGTFFAAAQDVRVRVNNGVPQIERNGEPQRGRWFWGAPGHAVLKIGPEAKALEFEMTGTIDDPSNITIHFRFDAKPNTIWLDDIRISDKETGAVMLPRRDFENGIDSFKSDWTFWPTGAANTVGTVDVVAGKGNGGSAALQISLKDPNGPWPDFHVYHLANLGIKKGHRYTVKLWARAATESSLRIGVYKPGQRFVQAAVIDGVFESQIRLAASVGVNFVSMPVHLPWPEPWKDCAEEFEQAFAECQRVLDANPKAQLVPRIGTYPPTWWAKANPDDMMVYEKEGGKPCFEVASPKWRAEAAERLGILIEKLEAKFGDSMAGYHPTGQNTAEWFYMDSWADRYHGNAPVPAAAFRDWLKKKYSTDEALQKAWGRSDVRLATVEPPTPQRRRGMVEKGILLDPKTDQDIIDHNFALQEIMVDGMLGMAKVVREKTHGKKLSVLFYGYLFEFTALNRGPAASGHYALRKVLDSPDVDILCSPISYYDRQLGGSAAAMTAAESVMLAGKLWLYEDDTSTHISAGNAPGSKERAKNSWESNQMLLRNVGEEACRNFAGWWMDLGSAGWFDDPAMWAEMKKLEAIDLPLLKNPIPFRPEIAVVIDEASAMYVAHNGNKLTRSLIYECRAHVARCGAPFGQYLLDDVLAGKVDHAKVFVFLNAWALTPEQRKTLHEKTAGKTRIWCYAPGAIEPGNGGGPDLEAIKELTGFTLKPFSESERPKVEGNVKPLFYIADAKPEETIAGWTDSAAIAVRGNDTVCCWPRLSPKLIRETAQKAGVPILCEDEAVLYSLGNFVVVHGTKDGPITLRWPQSVAWKDILSGEKLGNGNEWKLTLKLGETRILRVE